jgi:hypothetical protein
MLVYGAPVGNIIFFENLGKIKYHMIINNI